MEKWTKISRLVDCVNSDLAEVRPLRTTIVGENRSGGLIPRQYVVSALARLDHRVRGLLGGSVWNTGKGDSTRVRLFRVEAWSVECGVLE